MNPEFNPTSKPIIPIPNHPPPSSRGAQRPRKLHYRKSKQHSQQQPNLPKGVNDDTADASTSTNPSNVVPPPPGPQVTLLPYSGGLFEVPSPVMFRDMNTAVESDDPSAEPIIIQPNSYFVPMTFGPSMFPFTPRANSHQPAVPPEAVIQFLKSPEQEISPLTRPQVKLPFPLSRDCSSGGSSGSKPLQFVVLPIVEPVAPLKPLIPKPSFLSSQYGQFPYIPPFNLFKRPPTQVSQLDSSNVAGGSGQFVPILNRPAPPLPFVFVQSLPLELIGHNVEMDVLQQPSPTTTTEMKVKEPPSVPTPVVAAPPPITPVVTENIPSASRPLPLIVIEKVKTPGQPPSGPVAPAAAVVEISKQSIQKNSNGVSAPLSTISVVQPITAPGSGPVTAQQQKELQKTIEKLVPVAAAVLENVEQQHHKQKDQGRERDVANKKPVEETPPPRNSPSPPPVLIEPDNSVSVSTTVSVEPVKVGKVPEPDKTPLRAPLRPENTQENEFVVQNPINRIPYKKPDISSSEELGLNSGIFGDVEVTEA